MRKYPLDTDLFKLIDAEWKAYFLGLMFADGCNLTSGIAIGLQKSDKYILDIMKSLIFKEKAPELRVIKESIHPCKLKNQNFIHSHGGFRLVIHSQEIAKDFAQLGCVPRKSLILEFPTRIDKSLLSHFIRGYFDGDGCITIKKSGGQTFKIPVP